MAILSFYGCKRKEEKGLRDANYSFRSEYQLYKNSHPDYLKVGYQKCHSTLSKYFFYLYVESYNLEEEIVLLLSIFPGLTVQKEQPKCLCDFQFNNTYKISVLCTGYVVMLSLDVH